MKKLSQSKTIWFNFLSIVAIMITELSASKEFMDSISGYTIWVMIIGAMVNFGLRIVTDTAIGYDDNNPVEKANESIKDF